MAHALFPAATVAYATSDALAASRAAVRRSIEGAAALRASSARLASTRTRHASAMDRLARATAALEAARAR